MTKPEDIRTVRADPRLDYLRTVPDQVCLNWLADAVSGTIGMHQSTFFLGMMPLFRETEPLEMFDLCVAILREKAVAVIQENTHESPL